MQIDYKNLALVDMDEAGTQAKYISKVEDIWRAFGSLVSIIAGALSGGIGAIVGEVITESTIAAIQSAKADFNNTWSIWMPLYNGLLDNMLTNIKTRDDIIKQALMYKVFQETAETESSLSLYNEAFTACEKNFPILLDPINLAGGLLWKKYYNSNKSAKLTEDDALLLYTLKLFMNAADLKLKLPIYITEIQGEPRFLGRGSWCNDDYGFNNQCIEMPFLITKNIQLLELIRKDAKTKKTIFTSLYPYEKLKKTKIFKTYNLFDFVDKFLKQPYDKAMTSGNGKLDMTLYKNTMKQLRTDNGINESTMNSIQQKIDTTIEKYFIETLDIDLYIKITGIVKNFLNKEAKIWIDHTEYWNCGAKGYIDSCVPTTPKQEIKIDLFHDPYHDGLPGISYAYKTRGSYTFKDMITKLSNVETKLIYIWNIYATLPVYNPKLAEKNILGKQTKAQKSIDIKNLLKTTTDEKNKYILYGGIALGLFAAYRIMKR
ncbi:MAG: hypothetical protein M0P71_07620 [Melioribacteraceae bacterium]|jgi:hypothetical protein|nr:hypothetical protein [Melioribacteraceae bacterium]